MVIATILAAIVTFFHPVLKTIAALVVCLVATVLAVLSWRAPTKRESAWYVTSAAAAIGVAGLCFAYLP